jgi:hypothetical protein
MNPRILISLLAATVVAAILTALTLHSREASVRATSENAKLFPELMPKINDAAVLAVERKDGGYELRKNGDTWVVAEKGGYPADVSPIAKTLIALAQMTTVEPKTSDPARYPQLGVQDPGAEGSTATKLTVKDSGGAVLASVIVGKAHEGKQGSSTGQVYVRKPGEAQSWLAKGSLDLKEKAVDWLQKEILKVPRDRVCSVEVTHPDGEVVHVDREKPTDTNFTLHDIPPGKELSYPSVAGSMANALEWLNFEDVVPASEIDFSTGAGPVCRFETFDGLVVTIRTKDQDGKTYARFEAAYQAPSTPPADAASDPAAADPAKAKETKKSPEEVQKEVADLQARLAAWTYVIPAYNRSTFAKKKSEMLKDPGATNALGGEAAAPGDEEGGDEAPIVLPADGHADHDDGGAPPPPPAQDPEKPKDDAPSPPH